MADPHSQKTHMEIQPERGTGSPELLDHQSDQLITAVLLQVIMNVLECRAANRNHREAADSTDVLSFCHLAEETALQRPLQVRLGSTSVLPVLMRPRDPQGLQSSMQAEPCFHLGPQLAL